MNWQPNLIRTEKPTLTGTHGALWGSCSGLCGDCSDIWGNCSDIMGDLDSCGLTDEDRMRGVDIRVLVTD